MTKQHSLWNWERVFLLFQQLKDPLLMALLLNAFVPFLIFVYRIFFQVDVPDVTAVSISGQFSLFSLFNLAIKAFLLATIFHFLGKSKRVYQKRLWTAFVLCSGGYFLFLVLIYAFVSLWAGAITSTETSIMLTYLRLESIALYLEFLLNFVFILMLMQEQVRILLLFAIVRFAVTMIGDMLPFFGVLRLPLFRILASGISLAIYVILRKKRIQKAKKTFVMIYNKPSAPPITRRLQRWTNNTLFYSKYNDFMQWQEWQVNEIHNYKEVIVK